MNEEPEPSSTAFCYAAVKQQKDKGITEGLVTYFSRVQFPSLSKWDLRSIAHFYNIHLQVKT